MRSWEASLGVRPLPARRPGGTGDRGRAGGYPAVYLGAPWWFLDSPEGLRRFREATTETAGFANTSGFVDDTRAFCSIPVRHQVARRVDAAYLARLVADGRLPLDEAADTAAQLAYHLPKHVFRLGE